MKMKIVYFLFILLLGVFFISSSGGRASAGYGATGAPGEDVVFNGQYLGPGQTCGDMDCHGYNMSFGEPDINITVTVADSVITDQYIPNAEHQIEITINPQFGTPLGYGFQATVLDDDTLNIGIFSNPSENVQIESAILANNRVYADHKLINDNIFSFIWISDNSGKPVTVYANGATVNRDGESTDDSGALLPTTLRLFPKPLAVELTDFKVMTKEKNALLRWITETETDNECFTIQHSTNGINFQEITKINGAGNSTERMEYTYTHDTPVNGNNYYRLQMTDYQGGNTYSKIEVVNVNVFPIDIEIYPQPITSDAIIKAYSIIKTDIKIDIHATNGQLVQSNKKHIEVGNNTISLSTNQLIPGTYILVIQGDSFGKSTRKIIKL